jgi:hypothetical protein
LSLKNASSFRRVACGLCLLAGPALLLVATIVDPSDNSGGDDDHTKYLNSIKDNADAVQLNTALSIAGFALLVFGLTGLVHVIRERGVVLANIGGALAIIGAIFFVALITTNINDLNNAEHLDLKVADKLSDSVDDYWAAYVVFIPALLGTFLGFILLGAAVIRSKVAHVAAGILIIAGIVAVPFSENSDVLGIIASVLLLAGFGMVGLRILGMKDEQWDGRAPRLG